MPPKEGAAWQTMLQAWFSAHVSTEDLVCCLARGWPPCLWQAEAAGVVCVRLHWVDAVIAFAAWMMHPPQLWLQPARCLPSGLPGPTWALRPGLRPDGLRGACES